MKRFLRIRELNLKSVYKKIAFIPGNHDMFKVIGSHNATIVVNINFLYVSVKYLCPSKVLHWSKQLKDQPVLLFSSFVHNSPINEHKNTKLRENTCYERIN